ncbi:hypothetical protein G6F50_017834 [Rhizopus delemar]|uniref:Uncharacterized protein n=1 Tax=Rhizopus delemar TaxID=936053 RepID=A0A9P7C021_9FUNG|nr:hypothetical protein G6F50_017834 [Rhizopus delemar]
MVARLRPIGVVAAVHGPSPAASTSAGSGRHASRQPHASPRAPAHGESPSGRDAVIVRRRRLQQRPASGKPAVDG